MPNDLVVQEGQGGKLFLKRFILWPKQWTKYPARVPLIWSHIRYRQQNFRRLPNVRGVYAFVVKPGIAALRNCNYLMYVGKALDQTLRTRCPQYLAEEKLLKGRPRIKELLANWRTHLFLCFASVGGPKTNVTKAENDLLAAFLPPCNTRFPGRLSAIANIING